jgi:hypothetical protein
VRRRTWLAHTWRAPKTEQVARYDVPVSPGGMTALSGDLYGSTENTRKAPVADWERNIASGKADPKNAPELRARETHALTGTSANLETEPGSLLHG